MLHSSSIRLSLVQSGPVRSDLIRYELFRSNFYMYLPISRHMYMYWDGWMLPFVVLAYPYRSKVSKICLEYHTVDC